MKFSNIFTLTNETLGDAVLIDHVTKDEMAEEKEEMDKTLEMDSVIEDTIAQESLIKEKCFKIKQYNNIELSLVEQKKWHDKTLARKDIAIFNRDLVLAHEELTKSLLLLGGNESDLSCIRLSSENFNNKREYLMVSRENVLETLKKVGFHSLETLKSVGRNVRNFGTKVANFIKFREKQLINISQYCHEHESEKLHKLSPDQVRKVYGMFYMFIKSNNQELDLMKLLDYIISVERNPLLTRLDDLFKLAQNTERTGSDIDNFVESVQRDAEKIPYQKQLLEQINNESNLREASLYVLCCLGPKVEVYIKDPKNKGLGIKHEVFKYEIPNTPEFNLTNCSTYGQLDKIVNKVQMIYSNSNSYLKKLESINNQAIDKLNKYNNISDGDDMFLKQCLALIKEVGSDGVYKSIKQYNELTADVIKLCSMFMSAGIMNEEPANKKEENNEE